MGGEMGAVTFLAFLGALSGACSSSSRNASLEKTALVWQGEGQAVGVVDGEVLVRDEGRLSRVAPQRDGSRWSIAVSDGTVLPPPPGGREIWIAGDNLMRIDAQHGDRLPSPPLTRWGGVWRRRGDALLWLSSRHLVRYVPASGEMIWQVRRPEPGRQRAEWLDERASLSHDAVWVFAHEGLCGFAIADGRPRGCVAGVPHSARAVDDGALVVTAVGTELVAHDATDLTVRWRTALPPGHQVSELVAGRDWIAIATKRAGEPNGAYSVLAVRAENGTIVWRHQVAPGTYLNHVAAAGDLVSYYDSSDRALWAVRLPSGERTRVHQFDETLVVSTDVVGAAPALPDATPVILDGHVSIRWRNRSWLYRVSP